MHTWRIGEIDVVRVESMDFALPGPTSVPDWMVPAFATGTGEVRLAFSALAIRTPTANIVVDPWLADDHPRESPDAAGLAAAALGSLAEAGFPAETIDIVVNTHLDGIGWNTRPDGAGGWAPSFPNARYVYPAVQLATVDAGVAVYGDAGFARLRAMTDVAALVPPQHLTPEVAVVDAPGHDPGHVAVRVEHDGDLAIYPGHLVLSPFQVDDPGTPLAGEEEPMLTAATATRRAMLGELADRGGLLVTTLVGGVGGGRVMRGHGNGFRLVP